MSRLHSLRRAAALVAVIVAVGLVMPGAVLAGPQSPEPAPVVTLDHGGLNCLDSNPRTGLLSGHTNSSPSYYRNGVFASIKLKYDICNGSDDDHGVAAFVALTPRSAVSSTQIVQIGIVNCQSPWSTFFAVDLCYQFPNQTRYFYAYGGCVGGPVPRDLGPASAGVYNDYSVEKIAGYFRMKINSTTYMLDSGNAAVSCWALDNLKANWSVEKKDRGDSSGGSTTYTDFVNTQYRSTQSSSWQWTNWTPGACQFVAPTSPHNSACGIDGERMRVWD